MDKLMHPKEHDRRHMNDALEHWFKRNFGDIKPDDPLYARIVTAKDDARKIFGLDLIHKGEFT